jgi:hypothetical protein
LCVIFKPQERGHGPRWVAAQKEKKYIYILCDTKDGLMTNFNDYEFKSCRHF